MIIYIYKYVYSNICMHVCMHVIIKKIKYISIYTHIRKYVYIYDSLNNSIFRHCICKGVFICLKEFETTRP